MPRIAVEIEQPESRATRLVDLLDLSRPGGARLALTTIGDRQRRAIVRLFFIDGGRKDSLREIEIGDLPAEPAGKPLISLEGRFDGGTLRCAVYIGSLLHSRAEIDLRSRLRRPPWAWMAAAVAVIALLAVAIPVYRTVTSGSSPAAPAAKRVSGLPAGRAPAPAAEPAASPVPPQAREPAAERLAPPVPAIPPAAPKVSLAALPEPVTVLFAPESAGLSSEARAQLDDLAAVLRARPDAPVVIAGYCALFGSEAGREALSLERASAVAEYLTSQGWTPDAAPTVVGRAATEPVTEDRGLQYLNRRAVISATP